MTMSCFFISADNFDKFLADTLFPWTVRSLMMVYFIFIIRASIVNSYSAYIELASDQTSLLSFKEFKELLLEKAFPGYHTGPSTVGISSPPTKKARTSKMSSPQRPALQSRTEKVEAANEAKMDKDKEMYDKKIASWEKKIVADEEMISRLSKCIQLKKREKHRLLWIWVEFISSKRLIMCHGPVSHLDKQFQKLLSMRHLLQYCSMSCSKSQTDSIDICSKINCEKHFFLVFF